MPLLLAQTVYATNSKRVEQAGATPSIEVLTTNKRVEQAGATRSIEVLTTNKRVEQAGATRSPELLTIRNDTSTNLMNLDTTRSCCSPSFEDAIFGRSSGSTQQSGGRMCS